MLLLTNKALQLSNTSEMNLNSPSSYSFLGSAICSPVAAAIAQSMSTGRLGGSVALAMILGGFVGGYCVALLHSPSSNWSTHDTGGVYALPIFGIPVGNAILMLFR